MSKHDIGLIGLAVMGQNLVMNMANKGFSVGVYNRTTETTHEFLQGLGSRPAGVVEPGAADRIQGYDTLQDFVGSLASPRRVMIMVKAGSPVDAVIDQLKPLLAPGDIIIDGGNADYVDTNRRHKQLAAEGFRFIGTGVSGGEEGALKGPSIMPGGHPEAWPFVKDVFQKISAKVGPNNDIPCCDWVGEAGAGHYVKMVHNGIEYGDMQLICEAYYILKYGVGLSNAELYEVFREWNEGELESYLIEITRDIFTVKDKETGADLVDLILDTAGQKGTGKWMSQHALDLGVPTTLITEAVFARCLSAQKDARVRAEAVLSGPDATFTGDRSQFVSDVRQRCMRQSSAVMLRVMCSWMLRRRSLAGNCRTVRLPCCGVVAALFDRGFWRTSKRRSTRIRLWKICCWMTSFDQRSRRLSRPGVGWFLRQSSWVCLFPAFRPH